MTSITSIGTSWNRDWVAGEHGGESFKTTDAIVDVVNPQQIKVEKVFIGGSRGFEDRDAVTTKIAGLQMGSVVLVSPTHGATAAVRNAALKLGLEMHVYTARFEKYQTAEAAYFARDEEMIRDADRVVVFWNGRSPGTGHEVVYTKEIGKPIEIVMVDHLTSSTRAAPPYVLHPRNLSWLRRVLGIDLLCLFSVRRRMDCSRIGLTVDGRDLPGAAANSAEMPLAPTQGGIS